MGHLLDFWCFLYQIFIFTFTQRLISGFPASRILESRAKTAQSAEKVKAAGSESRPLMAWTWVCGFRPSSGEELGDLPLIVCDLTERITAVWSVFEAPETSSRVSLSPQKYILSIRTDLVTNGNRNHLWGKRPSKNSFCLDSSVRR